MRFHIEWHNHLREKNRYSWEPIEFVSDGKEIICEMWDDDGVYSYYRKVEKIDSTGKRGDPD